MEAYVQDDNEDEEKMAKSRGNANINDHMLRKNPYGKYEGVFVFCGAVFIAIAALITIGILQYDEYDGLIKNRFNYLATNAPLCGLVDFKNFDVLSTPIAAALLIIFIIFYKRRAFLVNKCSWRFIGLPMIVSLWNKTDRTYTAVVYGRIAFEVFMIVQGILQSDSSGAVTLPSPDPTGLFKLFMRIVEVTLIGIRYWPVLVAFRAKSCLIYWLSAMYMWIDFAGTIYQQGKCSSIVYDDETLETKGIIIGYWIGYKVLNIAPSVFFASYICVNLTYRTLITFKNILTTKVSSAKARCALCDVDDDYEIIYAHTDILYVLDLLHNPDRKNEFNELGKDLTVFTNVYRRIVSGRSNESDRQEGASAETKPQLKPKVTILMKIKNLFEKHVYKWEKTFKFTSRFINCHLVALLALFHFFMFFLYFVLELLQKITVKISLIDFQNLQSLTLGDLTCAFGDDFCIPDLDWKIPLPSQVVKFGKEFIPSLWAIALVPMFAALLVCIIQIFLSIRDTKTHLIELYKGKCVYLPPRRTLSNSSIASASFHYGGYLVGYLIWGYFIIFIFILIIALVITLLRMTIGDKIFEKFLLKLVPLICAFVVKKVINVLATRVIFLKRGTKVLALNNFRAFNVFLYFNFFFDCFMGVISAVIRIVKSTIAAVFMMPRISYSFVGRHLERSDNGYASYMGFLYMECAHTNPILITFCSLLYYKGLSDHVRMLVVNDAKKSKKFIGVNDLTLSDGTVNKSKVYYEKINSTRRKYNKIVVNKWHVIVFLAKNPILMMYRKDNLSVVKPEEKPQSKESKSRRILNLMKKCCKKNATSQNSSH